MSFDLKQQLPLLKEVQEIDKRIVQIEFELRNIPEQLESSGGELLFCAHHARTVEANLRPLTSEWQDESARLHQKAASPED